MKELRGSIMKTMLATIAIAWVLPLPSAHAQADYPIAASQDHRALSGRLCP